MHKVVVVILVCAFALAVSGNGKWLNRAHLEQGFDIGLSQWRIAASLN